MATANFNTDWQRSNQATANECWQDSCSVSSGCLQTLSDARAAALAQKNPSPLQQPRHALGQFEQNRGPNQRSHALDYIRHLNLNPLFRQLGFQRFNRPDGPASSHNHVYHHNSIKSSHWTNCKNHWRMFGEMPSVRIRSNWQFKITYQWLEFQLITYSQVDQTQFQASRQCQCEREKKVDRPSSWLTVKIGRNQGPALILIDIDNSVKNERLAEFVVKTNTFNSWHVTTDKTSVNCKKVSV